MRKMICVGFCTGLLSIAAAAGLSEWQPFHAEYVIFSGSYLAERYAPTPADRKLSIALDGKAAKDLFGAIGPDLRDSCSGDQGDRDRRSGGVQCSYRRVDNTYRCWVGIDLRTGNGYPTVSC